ncbi:MAG: ABC transporter permease, partial [Candidatus Berkiella sp.]
MFAYIFRRFLFMIPILLGVNILTFALFFLVNTPDDMARVHLGQKHVTKEAISNWKVQHGYDKPLFYDSDLQSHDKFTNTIFFQKSLKMFAFDFGFSDAGRDITYDISQRMWPSLAIAIPSLIIALFVNISLSLLMIFFRYSYLDTLGVVVCVMLMSISALFYIIGGQYLIAKLLLLVPISGYIPGWQVGKFLILPVLVGVISGIGSGVRWYRTLFLEEAGKDYVQIG